MTSTTTAPPAAWAEGLDLDAWLKDYTLDEVWRLGRMGARPSRIAIIVEGRTEQAFLPHLRTFLQTRLAGRMPKLDPVPYDGRLPTGPKLRREVEKLLNNHRNPADAVIALTDVYTGSQPPEFADAADAKARMRQWVAHASFHPHAAQHDFEAWLLPYWPRIQQLAGSNRDCPGVSPERVDHMNPPARHLAEMFRTGSRGRRYIKPRDAARILRRADLLVAADACPELKAFLNTILTLCGTAQSPENQKRPATEERYGPSNACNWAGFDCTLGRNSLPVM